MQVKLKTAAGGLAAEIFLKGVPHSLYHHAVWLDIIKNSFSRRIYCITAEEDGALKGILPIVHFNSIIFGNFLVSMPYFNYGGVCSEYPHIREALFRKAAEAAEALGASYAELRHREDYFPGLPVRKNKVTFLLDLSRSPDLLWRNLSAKVRNEVRKAEKAGYKVSGGTYGKLRDFYGVFSANMRDLGTPVYSIRFFRNVLSGAGSSARIFTVGRGGVPAAAGFTLAHEGVLEIPWASSLRRYNRYCPNMLLYWEIIRYACINGYRQFDFGRCSKGSGTYRFKRQWGGREKQLYWHYWLRKGKHIPELNPDNPKYRLFINVWKRMPVWLSRAAGQCIMRNIP